MIADIQVKVYTGAQGNTLPLRMFHQLYSEKIDKPRVPKLDVGKDRRITLTAYGGRILPHYGMVTLHCEVKMDIKAKINLVDDLRKYYPDQFDMIGEFPDTYHIILNKEAQPVIHAPTMCLIHLRDELEKELTKVDELTDWVSSLVMSRK